MTKPVREEVPDHTAERWEKVGELRIQNAAKIDRLEAHGTTFDLGLPRVEVFMQFLCKQGIITEDQRVDEALAWEEKLNDMLDAAQLHLETQLEELRKQATAPKLVLPPHLQQGGNRAQRRGKRG